MNFTFNQKIRKFLASYETLVSEVGELCAKKFLQRLDEMKAAESLEILRNAPGNYTEIIPPSKLFSCKLDRSHRILFKPHEETVKFNQYGECIWDSIRSIEIITISKIENSQWLQ